MEIEMREIKFRAWDVIEQKMWEPIVGKNGVLMASNQLGGFVQFPAYQDPLMQYTGLKDKNGADYFIGDVGQFDNGDRFVLRLEDWLEVYADWIGDAACEDQVRDLYRISAAENIGNIYENPELLEAK
jgi:hypothetical protein